MKPFLQRVAEDIYNSHRNNMADCIVVLPSRRAVIFFKQYLSNLLEKPVWSPTITTLQDLVQQHSKYTVQEELNLVLLLYKLQKQQDPNENLASFYHWGKMLLKDFDDVDRHLADGASLFSNLSAAKELEMWEPGDSVEDPERVKQFWTSVGDEPRSAMKNKFGGLWASAEKLYRLFSEELQQRGWAYEGMAYRELAQEVEKGWRPAGDKVFFVGFNALSRAEEKILLTLQKAGVAAIYIDADKYYVEDEGLDAGQNIRKLLQKMRGREPKWISDNLLSAQREITFAGAAGEAGQAKALAAELDLLSKQQQVDWERTAVVLPNEGLLFPVLYSLPQQVQYLNITMGYPLRNTPLFSFLQDVQRLQENIGSRSGGTDFYHKYVVRLVRHPYTGLLEDEKKLDALDVWVKKNQVVRVTQEQVFEHLQSEEITAFFKKFTTPAEVIELLLNVSEKLFSIFQEQKDEHGNPDAEFFAAFGNLIRQLQNSLQELPDQIEMAAFWKILNTAMQGASVPFTGEPLRGLQIMGMLESRTLDFENIYILSANEGVLPSFSHHGSFIPYDLRKGFGLPTYEDQTSIYSYHFYRAIQRAKKVCIIYNNKIDNFSKGEKSRYLLQLEHLLAPKSGLSITKKTYSGKAGFEEVKEISVAQSEASIQELQKIAANSGFSASALISYMLCPLKFYLQRLLGIKEPEEVEEELSGSSFGSVYHDAMEFLYKDRGEVTKATIDELLGKVDEALEYSAAKNNINLQEALKGRNFFLLETIKILLQKTLQKDAELVPFQVRGLEQDIRTTLEVPGIGVMNLRGFIDRIDATAEGTRIVDYKTGSVDKLEYDFETELPEVTMKNKEAFQAALYSFIYAKQTGQHTLYPNILPLKKLNDGYQPINKGVAVREEQLEKFGQQLVNLFSGMFSMETEYLQTEDTDYCTYCAFNKMCARK